MLAYHYYHLNGDKSVEGHEMIEKLKDHVYKGHRDALSFDNSIIIQAMKESFLL